MAHEALPGGTSDSDPLSEGQQLQAQLLRLTGLIFNDLVDRLPIYEPEAEEDFEEAYDELDKLIRDRIDYNPKFDASTGTDGLSCVYFNPSEVWFSTVAGYDVVQVTLSTDGESVSESSKRRFNFLEAMRRKALKSEAAADESDEPYTNPAITNSEGIPVSLQDILGSYAPAFLPRVLQKMRQAEAWFIECRASGVDPFSDEAW